MSNAHVGDGFCNDEINNAYCNYDHGDCCLSNINTKYLSESRCPIKGVIASPGFPFNYDNNMVLIWMIKVQLGQFIKIEFLSFDVEYESSNCQ